MPFGGVWAINHDFRASTRFPPTPPTLELTVLISVRCASACAGSSKKPEAERVLRGWGGCVLMIELRLTVFA